MLHSSSNPGFRFISDGSAGGTVDPSWNSQRGGFHQQQQSCFISVPRYHHDSQLQVLKQQHQNHLSQEQQLMDSTISSSGISSPPEFYSHTNLATHQANAVQGSAGQGCKRKRCLPGTPDPEAEVIALSPKTLMTTNRFICEICNKGFQRDQNLQLHRRGHNLPWKLRQRSPRDVNRRRVYVCPEPSCVHHDPARALGDLTGIKKHFCRKHGEKKWKCDKCAKKYAVQSDWKAHCKSCGTREYRCDCGTLFSRRDSFITHRAFCDALAEESARVKAAAESQARAAATTTQNDSTVAGGGGSSSDSQSFLQQQQASDVSEIICGVPGSVQESLENSSAAQQWPTSTGLTLCWSQQQDRRSHLNMYNPQLMVSNRMSQQQNTFNSCSPSRDHQFIGPLSSNSCSSSLSLNCTTSNSSPSFTGSSTGSTSTAQMSATALLLKASQIGATSSSSSSAMTSKSAGLVMESPVVNANPEPPAAVEPPALTSSNNVESHWCQQTPTLVSDFTPFESSHEDSYDHHLRSYGRSKSVSFTRGAAEIEARTTSFTHDFLGVGGARKDHLASFTTLASGVV